MLYATGSVASAVCVPTGHIVGGNGTFRPIFDLTQGHPSGANTFFTVHCTGSGTIGVNLPPTGDRGDFQNKVMALYNDVGIPNSAGDLDANLDVLFQISTNGSFPTPDQCPKDQFNPNARLVSSVQLIFAGKRGGQYSVGLGREPYYSYSNNECLTLIINHGSNFVGVRNSTLTIDPNVSYYELLNLSGTIVTYAVRYIMDPGLPEPEACMPSYEYWVSPKRFDFGKVDQTVFNNGGERVSSDIEFTIKRARQNVGTCDQETLVPKLTLTVESGPTGYSVAGNRVYLNNGTSLGIYRVAPGTQTEIPFSSGEVVDFGALGGPSSILESTQFVRVKWRGNPGETAVVGSPWSVVMRYLIDIR